MVRPNGRWLGKPAWIFGNSREIIPIAAFGLHFELIIRADIIDELPINEELLIYKNKIVREFIPQLMFNGRTLVDKFSDDVNEFINKLLLEIIEIKETIYSILFMNEILNDNVKDLLIDR